MTHDEPFRRMLWFALTMMAGQSLLFARPAEAALTLAEKGNARLVVALSDAPGEESTAAGDLVRCLTQATGATFEQVAEKDVRGRPAIFVGATRSAGAAGISAAGMDQDGFVIKAEGGNLFIVGQDALAIEMGVYYFLQRYVGVRWYIPLDIGEHIPSRPTLTVPSRLAEKREPSWESRRWTGANKDTDWRWMRRNLMRQRYHGNGHTLHDIIKPSECYDKRPDWFPLIDGKRVAKPADGSQNWQPCFANRDLAEYVAHKAIHFFNTRPDRVDYPLGILDSRAEDYCQCEACRALDDPARPTFRGRPNYSNRVFTFINRVAEIVSRTHPDKFLSCLAYDNCEDVPSFPVHPMVMPCLTNERAHWWNEEFKAQDQDLLRRWGKAARQFGIYDYYYGRSYVIPRVYTTVSAESIKFSHGEGARGWYAELNPVWGLDGCKAWLASRLLWDVTLDPKELADDYYRDFFGAAQEPMKKYWEHVESCWMNQGGEAVWFKGRHRIEQVDQIGFSPDVQRELRGDLDQAAQLADNDLVRRRVALYSNGFRYTELYSQLYWAEQRLRQTLERRGNAGAAQPKDAAQSVRQELLALILAQQELQQFYDTVYNKDPLIHGESTFRTYVRWRYGEDLLLPAFARIADDSVNDGRSLRERIRLSDQLAADNPAARMYAAYMTMRTRPGTALELLANPGFEMRPGAKAGLDTPNNPDWNTENCPHGWSNWVPALRKAELRWMKEPVRSGGHAVMIKGAEQSGMYFSAVPAKPGDILLFSVYVNIKTVSSQEAAPGQMAPIKGELRINWRDSENKWLPVAQPSVSLPWDTGGAWERVDLIFIVPQGVTTVLPFLVGQNQGPDDVAYFDDASLITLPAE